MANDEEPVEKALVASSSVAITSKDGASSSLTILMAPAESLPGEVREPLSGEASAPLSGGRITAEERGSVAKNRGTFTGPHAG